MVATLLIAGAILLVIILRLLARGKETCPDCGRERDPDSPICACGWVFEYPDDGAPLEYGDPDDLPP